MQHSTPVETIWEQALEAFPFPDLQSTGYVDGDLESPNKNDIIYQEEFTIDAGNIIHEPLEGGGWLEVYRGDRGEISICALFGVACNGDWKEGRIFPHCTGIHAEYDIEKKRWEMTIGTY
jgi:hypothetical protein